MGGDGVTEAGNRLLDEPGATQELGHDRTERRQLAAVDGFPACGAVRCEGLAGEPFKETVAVGKTGVKGEIGGVPTNGGVAGGESLRAVWFSFTDAKGVQPTSTDASSILPVPPQSAMVYRNQLGQATRMTEDADDLTWVTVPL